MELENGKKFEVDVMQWVKDHQKQIAMFLGAVCLGRFCYKRGYKKGEKDMNELLDAGIAAAFAIGGAQWTK